MTDDRALATALDRVFSRPEFQESWWEMAQRRAFDALLRAAHWIADRDLPVQIAILVGLCGLLVLLVWHLVRAFRAVTLDDRGRRSFGVPEADIARTPAQLLADAERFVALGDPRAAARALQEGMLLLRCEREAIDWEPSRCDDEWLARFGRPADLTRFTRSTQQVAFGTASPALLADCADTLRAELSRGAA